MENNKRFEEWEEVDCNQCARYWDSSCDGADKRICTSYLATREVVIPAQIKKLEKKFTLLNCAVFLLALSQLIQWLVNNIG